MWVRANRDERAGSHIQQSFTSRCRWDMETLGGQLEIEINLKERRRKSRVIRRWRKNQKRRGDDIARLKPQHGEVILDKFVTFKRETGQWVGSPHIHLSLSLSLSGEFYTPGVGLALAWVIISITTAVSPPTNAPRPRKFQYRRGRPLLGKTPFRLWSFRPSVSLGRRHGRFLAPNSASKTEMSAVHNVEVWPVWRLRETDLTKQRERASAPNVHRGDLQQPPVSL